MEFVNTNSALGKPTWEIAEVITNVVLETLSTLTKRPIIFDMPTLSSLHMLYEKGPILFWTVLDQFYEMAKRKEWPDDTSELATRAHIQILLKSIHPIMCEIPEPEFIQMMIRKLWPADDESLTPPAIAYSSGSPIINATSEADNRFFFVPPLDDDVVENALRNVYTWSAAEKVLQQVEARLTQEVGRSVSFDEMHINKIRARYDEDPLGFWSVFDQMQEQLMAADWKSVRNDARFIQSFLHKYSPSEKPLSEFMAAAIPPHPLVPYGTSPTVLRSLRSCDNLTDSHNESSSFASGGNSGYSSASDSSPTVCIRSPLEGSGFGHHHHSVNVPSAQDSSVRRRGSFTPSPKLSVGSGASSPGGLNNSKSGSESGDDVLVDEKSDPHYPYTWRAAEAAMLAVEHRLLEKSGREIVFDDKHRSALLCKWEQDPKGFFSVLDQVQERLMQSKWETVRDVGGYIQSLIGRFEPQPIVSKFIQSFVMTPEVAAETAALEAESSEIVAIPWSAIFDKIIPAVEEHTSICVGRTVRFDDKHKYHMKQRYDRNILSFWSVFDQVQERMASSDWSTVRDDARFIQSFITRSEPKLPLVLSPFLAAVTDAVINNTDVKAAVLAHAKPNNTNTSGK